MWIVNGRIEFPLTDTRFFFFSSAICKNLVLIIYTYVSIYILFVDPLWCTLCSEKFVSKGVKVATHLSLFDSIRKWRKEFQ